MNTEQGWIWQPGKYEKQVILTPAEGKLRSSARGSETSSWWQLSDFVWWLCDNKVTSRLQSRLENSIHRWISHSHKVRKLSREQKRWPTSLWCVVCCIPRTLPTIQTTSTQWISCRGTWSITNMRTKLIQLKSPVLIIPFCRMREAGFLPGLFDPRGPFWTWRGH